MATWQTLTDTRICKIVLQDRLVGKSKKYECRSVVDTHQQRRKPGQNPILRNALFHYRANNNARIQSISKINTNGVHSATKGHASPTFDTSVRGTLTAYSKFDLQILLFFRREQRQGNHLYSSRHNFHSMIL